MTAHSPARDSKYSTSFLGVHKQVRIHGPRRSTVTNRGTSANVKAHRIAPPRTLNDARDGILVSEANLLLCLTETNTLPHSPPSRISYSRFRVQTEPK